MTTMARAFATADLCDAHGDGVRVLEAAWIDYGGLVSFSGAISTLKAWEDNGRVREALDEVGAGRVLVVDAGGSLRRSMLGDQLARKAVANGWSGLVILGAIRDSAAIATLALGVKALATCPRKTEKLGTGQRDVALHVGGIDVRPGEWLYADRDGVVIAATSLA